MGDKRRYLIAGDALVRRRRAAVVSVRRFGQRIPDIRVCPSLMPVQSSPLAAYGRTIWMPDTAWLDPDRRSNTARLGGYRRIAK
jgi:hypothetical protein